MAGIHDTIREIVATELEIPVDHVLPSSELEADLGVDSLAAVQIGYEIEATLGVQMPNEIVDVQTVADLVSFVENLVGLEAAS